MKNKRIGPKSVMKTAAALKSKATDVSRKKKPMHVDKVDSRSGNLVSKKKKESAKAEKALEFNIDRNKKSSKLLKLEAEPVSKKDSKKIDKMSARLQTQLAVIGDVKPRAVQRAIADNFGEAAPQIVQMLEMNDNDGAIIVLQKRLLQSSIAMLVHAEKLMVDTQGAKGTYQYATLVSQIRELITDIQAARDRSFIANQIMQSIIQPAFIDMAEMIMNKHSGFRKELLDDSVIPEKFVAQFNSSLRGLAQGMAQQLQLKYRDVEMKLLQSLTS
jgi:hypothetical protein